MSMRSVSSYFVTRYKKQNMILVYQNPFHHEGNFSKTEIKKEFGKKTIWYAAEVQRWKIAFLNVVSNGIFLVYYAMNIFLLWLIKNNFKTINCRDMAIIEDDNGNDDAHMQDPLEF